MAYRYWGGCRKIVWTQRGRRRWVTLASPREVGQLHGSMSTRAHLCDVYVCVLCVCVCTEEEVRNTNYSRAVCLLPSRAGSSLAAISRLTALREACVISQRLNMKMISRAGSSNQWCLCVCVCVCVLSVFEFVCEWTPSPEKAASFPCHYLTLHPLKQRGLVHHVMWMTTREWEFCKDILVLRQHEKWMCVFSMWSV